MIHRFYPQIWTDLAHLVLGLEKPKIPTLRSTKQTGLFQLRLRSSRSSKESFVLLQVSRKWLELVDLEITSLGLRPRDTGLPMETLKARFPNLATMDFG